MKKQIILLCLIVFSNFKTFSQIVTTFSQKNPYEFKIKSTSDFNIVNSGVATRVDIKVSLLQNQKEIYVSNYLNYTCQTGNNSFLNIIPTNEKFLSLNSFAAMHGELSSGEYELCISVKDITTSEEINQNCFDITVSTLNPPFLIYPTDLSTINILNPTLIWSPPLGSKRNENFTYDLKLVEQLNNQQSIDAINQNFAILKLSNLNSTQLIYPFNAQKLVNGKSYSWQVVARNSNGYVANTEIWTFTVKEDSLSDEKVVFFEGYILAKKAGIEGEINLKDEMKIYFEESYQLNNLTFEVLNASMQLITKIDNESIVELGKNRFLINLKNISQLQNKKTYFLKAVNKNNQESYLIKYKLYK